MIGLSAVFAIALALVHVFGAQLHLLDVIPRSRWLSAAGGISVAYVFVHILPELSTAQATVEQSKVAEIRFVEHHVYLVALIGLIISYSLAHLVDRSSQAPAESDVGVFWLHIGSFALYNGLVGYLLLHRGEEGTRQLILFSLAMGLHFLVNDYGLRRDHRALYHDSGRWVLTTAVVLGWLIGLVTSVSEALVAVMFAFLAGGIVLNVLKEELPKERSSRLGPFVVGTTSYAALLILLG